MQLVSDLLYNKKMFPFMQAHVHWINLIKKRSHQDFKGLKFWAEGLH
jgi:hypothetical protein